MSQLKFTEEHEWISAVEDGVAKVGITDYAQEQLGDVVYVELPAPGARVETGGGMAVVESVKAAGDVKAPVSGEVVEVNTRLADTPELVNSDPTGDGWFVKIRVSNAADLDKLMDEAAYQEFIKGL